MITAFRAEVRNRAGECCEYCLIPEDMDVATFHMEHVVAIQHGGETVPENLAWSCWQCNSHKGTNIASIDPVSGALARLFHPRRDRWKRHFAWDGPVLVGRTRSARATIRILAINDADQVRYRRRLMADGFFTLG